MSESSPLLAVLVATLASGPYTYLGLAGEPTPPPGTIVQVPLRGGQTLGVVWDTPPDTSFDLRRVRSLTRIYEGPPLKETLRRFIDWSSNWTLTRAGMILRMVLSATEGLESAAPQICIRRSSTPLPSTLRLTPARKRILSVLEHTPLCTPSFLAEEADVSQSVVRELLRCGALEKVDFLPSAPLPSPLAFTSSSPRFLTEIQQKATMALCAAEGQFEAFLLDGVTGSGKTEVYFEALAHLLSEGGQALILLPEISLTSSLLERFEKRFGVAPHAWHSNLSSGQRAKIWRQVRYGTARVVIGARSALFLPFSDLRFLVLDEEHDSGFKQEDRVFYQGRDLAVMRASFEKCPVVLCSATPSIETWHNAQRGRYTHLVLSERSHGKAPPELSVIDMRQNAPPRGCFLSPPLVQHIQTTLEAQKQVLLFLNRRGYAPLTLCRSCGHRFQCCNCTAFLVLHRRSTLHLLCHHCGYQRPLPSVCPECTSEETLVPCGPGVQRIDEEIAHLFPTARRLILSSDNSTTQQSLEEDLRQITEGHVDIVIGTQVIAKGHNFPLLHLVGVVDADLGLSHSEMRAAERTFQLMAQVTGRAGRSTGGGVGLLQSYMPEHPLMQTLIRYDRDAFYTHELKARETLGLPPFGRLASLIISSKTEAQAQLYAQNLVQSAPVCASLRILGPVPAPRAVLRGRYRFRLLVQTTPRFNLQAYLRQWLSSCSPAPNTDLLLQIDVDPQSFF